MSIQLVKQYKPYKILLEIKKVIRNISKIEAIQQQDEHYKSFEKDNEALQLKLVNLVDSYTQLINSQSTEFNEIKAAFVTFRSMEGAARL